jgi:hypothetical protein
MEYPATFRRVSGALEFIAELQVFALECAAAAVWDDELAARRRQRDDGRGSENRLEQVEVKTL